MRVGRRLKSTKKLKKEVILEKNEALKVLEVILFVSDEPVPADDIASILDGIGKENVSALVADLNESLEERGLYVLEIAEGFQLRTRTEYGEYVKKFHKIRRSTRLSQPSIETLSMIAYKQPVTRQEIEDIRGVDSSGVLKTLLDKGLIKTMGRKKVPGRPMTFGTAKKFLEYFGLYKLTDLPTLKDLPDDLDIATMQEDLDFPAGQEEPEEKIIKEIEKDGEKDGEDNNEGIEEEPPRFDRDDGDDEEEDDEGFKPDDSEDYQEEDEDEEEPLKGDSDDKDGSKDDDAKDDDDEGFEPDDSEDYQEEEDEDEEDEESEEPEPSP